MKNEKIYLQELNFEELQKVFDNNEKFKNIVFDDVYESNMDYQLFLSEEFFGKNAKNYLEIKDHYASFYTRIKDATKFFENLNINISDYLIEEDSKKYIELYKQAKKYYNNLNKCNYDSSNCYKNEKLLENTCKEILSILENELHKLEDISEEEVYQYFIDNIEIYNDFYITEKTTFSLYEDITKCYN